MEQTSLTPIDLGDPAIDSANEQLSAEWGLNENSLMAHIDRGRQGLNRGISNGMKTLNRYLYGTHRATYYLIGADSGVGKTTIADFMYVYNLYEECRRLSVPCEIDYYSWEIDAIMKKAKWASLLYFIKYQKILPPQYILGRVNGLRVTDDERAKLATVVDKVEEMFRHIKFIEASKSPRELWNRLIERAGQHGELKLATKKDPLDSRKNIVGYTPKDPLQIRMTVVDHLALIDTDGMTLKQAMDTASINFTRLRNLLGDSFCVIQQFNTEMQSAARETKREVAYTPTRQDFGDSKYTFRDADVVMGLMRPSDFKLGKFAEVYTNLDKWGHYFVVNTLIKNRYGDSGRQIPMFMNPLVGIPTELPTGSDWSSLVQDVYIDKAAELDKTNAYYTPKI